MAFVYLHSDVYFMFLCVFLKPVKILRDGLRFTINVFGGLSMDR